MLFPLLALSDLILRSAERASRRMNGTSRAFMVRDGAFAPPHHEGWAVV